MNSTWLIPEHMQRLWIVHTMARNKGLLNIGADIVIKGRFNLEELRLAFTAAICRHDVFRARFNIGPSGVECQLLEKPIIRWQIENVSDDSGLSQESFHTLIADKERVPLPVEEGSSIRGTLYLFGQDLAVLAVTAHHLVADAWTIRVLVEDILYEWRRLRGETVSSIPSQGSVCSILSQPGTCSMSQEKGTLECNLQSSFSLPLDHVVSHENRTGRGAEIVVRLDRRLSQELRQLNGANDLTFFVRLTGALLLHLSDICATQTVQAGILMTTRDLRQNRRTAGCFVQAVPVVVSLSPEVTTIQVMKDINNQLRDLRGRALQNQLFPTNRFPVMISMVRDSSVDLIAPDGIGIRYERRRRTQAECDLHVFFYEHGDGVEAVFNYDSDVLNADTVSSWADGYVRLLDHICRSPMIPLREIRDAQGIYALSQDFPSIACNLQHIGLAVWELDIGLRRLASVGILQQGESWEDDGTGVAMALAGSPEGLQLEVVAPLREDAPCVGALTRDGEGPYHCCWRVGDVNAILDAMNQFSIRYSVIRRCGSSGLFPSETITFLIVEGFGLVEFLHGFLIEDRSDESAPVQIRVRTCIESNDNSNARRFLKLLGYRPAAGYPHDGPQRICVESNAGHVFSFVQRSEQRTSRIAWIEYSHHNEPTTKYSVNQSMRAERKMITAWWLRFRFVDWPDTKPCVDTRF